MPAFLQFNHYFKKTIVVMQVELRKQKVLNGRGIASKEDCGSNQIYKCQAQARIKY